MADLQFRPLHAAGAAYYVMAQRRPNMSTIDYKEIDLTRIQTEARKLRAEYIRGWFKRRNG